MTQKLKPGRAEKLQAPINDEPGGVAAAGDSAEHAEADTAPSPRASGQCLIVGIGASAGGLEAFKSFFAHMPADNGLAFVLVQHLAPDHVSLLAELIGRSTSMTVSEAANGVRVQAGHVYVIPPDATLTIAKGVLKVRKPAPPRQHRWPINTSFTSLAEDQGDCAVCIVLSGTGSDGARGLRVVKEHGGLTMAQSGFDHVAMTGMPASAVATGLVDHILAVEEMPARLIAHRQHLQVTHDKKGPDGARQDLAAHLKTICGLLHAQVGHDFSQYKEKTLVRRIQRRMQVTQTDTVLDYIAYLRKHPDEHEELFREVLIGVTQFFRDPLAFEALQQQAIPALLADRGAADTLRVWVPGCATGEEAYSIAMVLREAIGQGRGGPKVLIFSTDIDDFAISAARAGRYRGPLTGVSPERQERWFTRDGEDYCVRKELREMCVFSPHSVIKDPAFSRLDLVSCRNLLIYLNAELQERLVRTFHYALKPGGFLLLGPSESLARNASLFASIDTKHRLYQRRGDSGVGAPAMISTGRTHPAGPIRGPGTAQRPEVRDLIDLAARRIVEEYSPAYVVIDENCEILRFGGDTGRYLGPATGTASLNLFTLLQRGLRSATRAAVEQTFGDGRRVVNEDLLINGEGRHRSLRLVVEQLPQTAAGRKLCLVAFGELARARSARSPEDRGNRPESAQIEALERELEAFRSQLHSAVDQHELLNEELKSTNEEYQSVNEELQSANEELETSKEEMQSINEELQTVNAELGSKNEALSRVNNDLKNLLDSTQIATLFLDAELRVGIFTPTITELFHLRTSDRGRPITEIGARVNYPDLKQDVDHVLNSLGMVERVLQEAEDGSSYLMRMRPYRTNEQVVDGVVLTFVDISERRRHEAELARLAAIVDSSSEIIIGHALDGSITSWNASAEHLLGFPANAMIGQSLSLLLPTSGSAQDEDFLTTFAQSESGPLEMHWLRYDGSTVEVAVTCSPVNDADGNVVAGSLTARDVSERVRAAHHLELMLAELNHRVKNTLASVQAIALQTLASAPTPQEFKQTFMARLQSLSGTHNLLAGDAWNGVGVREILLAELAPYQRDGQVCATIDCDKLQLSPKTALALGMTLHELTTNAVKYGALSVPEGRLEVSCEARSRSGKPWLHLAWRELDGPPVSPPTRRGFGSRLINEGLAFELDGEVSLEFAPEGVVCKIDIPLSEEST